MAHIPVIVGAARTAIGNFTGSLAAISAAQLGSKVIQDLLKKTNLSKDEISEVILGQVLQAGTGQNPARQASIFSGLPDTVPAMTINKVCGSGLKAVMLAAQAVKEDGGIFFAGGQENMSQSPRLFMESRIPSKMGDISLKDSMIIDGLWCAFNNYHMGITAENIATKISISREAQDEFAYRSQMKAVKAISEGKFKDEIVSVEIPGPKGTTGTRFEVDEFPRASATIEGFAKLKPAFIKTGTVTAGNSSGLNDGAAVLLVTTKALAEKKGLPILASIKACASAGVDPKIMGLGVVPAVKKCLSKAGWSLNDLDLLEANEAFAAQSLGVMKELGVSEDFQKNKVNVNGGAIALGHPIGASGARILVTLIHELKRRNAKKGLATLCIGGGQGVALAIERS